MGWFSFTFNTTPLYKPQMRSKSMHTTAQITSYKCRVFLLSLQKAIFVIRAVILEISQPGRTELWVSGDGFFGGVTELGAWIPRNSLGSFVVIGRHQITGFTDKLTFLVESRIIKLYARGWGCLHRYHFGFFFVSEVLKGSPLAVFFVSFPKKENLDYDTKHTTQLFQVP